jgi:hypothetical protein
VTKPSLTACLYPNYVNLNQSGIFRAKKFKEDQTGDKVWMKCYEETRGWAVAQFGLAQLDDIRRVERAVHVAEAMALSPGGSINQLFHDRYDVKAAYNLFKREDVTPDNLQAGHRQLTMEALYKPGRYLLLEDTSEISFSGRAEIKGLGPIGEGNKGQQGFHLHSVLAARYEEEGFEGEGQNRPPLEVLGLCDQQYYIRQRRPEEEARRDSRARQHRDRESQLWETATKRIGPAPTDEAIEWIRVGDRGADIYEHLLACQRMGHGYIIRATQSRALVSREGGVARRSGVLLFDHARSMPEQGEMTIRLRGRSVGKGRKKSREEREARLKVSAATVELSAPPRPGMGAGKGESIKCNVVRVWEEETPEGEDPLEWILLTDSRTDNFERVRSVARQYASRWLIEEFHKALKTGMGAERLQLESGQGLFAAIAMMSVVALRLIRLKEQVRIDANAEAGTAGFSEEQLTVLKLASKRELKTVGDIALAIGKLGGHLNRKSDGMPGWQTLWRGMKRLSDLLDGYLLARKLHEFG